MSISAPDALLADAGHRAFPYPARRWVMRQTWHNLLFAHWQLAPDIIRALLPPGLPLDTFDGAAWVAVVPFHMSGIRLHGLPALPLGSAFAEMNVRTYVTLDGKPGVWFFSLDAADRFAVEIARMFYHLPYFNADMRVQMDGETVTYSSIRTDRRAPVGEFRGVYRPTAPAFRSAHGTLEHWLTERYCLYAADGHGRLYRGDIHHAPWQLQTAEADIQVNTVAQSRGIPLPDVPPLLHYAGRIDVLAWSIERAGWR